MWGQRGLGAQHLPTNIAGKYKDTGQKKLRNLSPLHSLQNHESVTSNQHLYCFLASESVYS